MVVEFSTYGTTVTINITSLIANYAFLAKGVSFDQTKASESSFWKTKISGLELSFNVGNEVTRRLSNGLYLYESENPAYTTYINVPDLEFSPLITNGTYIWDPSSALAGDSQWVKQ